MATIPMEISATNPFKHLVVAAGEPPDGKSDRRSSESSVVVEGTNSRSSVSNVSVVPNIGKYSANNPFVDSNQLNTLQTQFNGINLGTTNTNSIPSDKKPVPPSPSRTLSDSSVVVTRPHRLKIVPQEAHFDSDSDSDRDSDRDRYMYQTVRTASAPRPEHPDRPDRRARPRHPSDPRADPRYTHTATPAIITTNASCSSRVSHSSHRQSYYRTSESSEPQRSSSNTSRSRRSQYRFQYSDDSEDDDRSDFDITPPRSHSRRSGPSGDHSGHRISRYGMPTTRDTRDTRHPMDSRSRSASYGNSNKPQISSSRHHKHHNHNHNHKCHEKSHSSSSRRKKGADGAPLDSIDRLDVTGLFGSGAFHHDGPFDACTPHRNKNTKKAPVMAFPIDGPNNSIAGAFSGKFESTKNQTIDAVMGNDGTDEIYNFQSSVTGNDTKPINTTNGSTILTNKAATAPVGAAEYTKPSIDPSNASVVEFDAKQKAIPVHGDTTLGLGSSTFLDGAPASQYAIVEDANLSVKPRAGDGLSRKKSGSGGLSRKKSLVQRLRGN